MKLSLRYVTSSIFTRFGCFLYFFLFCCSSPSPSDLSRFFFFSNRVTLRTLLPGNLRKEASRPSPSSRRVFRTRCRGLQDAAPRPSLVSSRRFCSAAVGSAGHGNCCCYATQEKLIRRTILAKQWKRFSAPSARLIRGASPPKPAEWLQRTELR